jgi:DNA invertase Pin-like site-specific DNA recombinase
VTRSPESLVNVKSGASSPSSTTRPSSRRAVGVVRVSEVGDRETATLDDQRQRIEDWCAREGLELVDVLPEEDVSGGRPLARRTGLRPAVEAIEDGRAGLLVVAYFDRLVRSLAVQAEVLDRVEAAGGRVVALDVGEVSASTSAQWLSSTFLGAVAEYHRRATAERTEDAKRRAIERGEPPYPNVPPGYQKRDDGRLEPSEDAPAVAEAFRLRAEGATVMDVRDHLRANGIERSFHGTQALLGSRGVLGELHFGGFPPNLEAWEPIVDPEVWEACQRARVPRGRRPKSERLLSRLGVLRCGTCGARMVVGTTRQGRKSYAFYRCPPVGDCPRRVTISADVAERAVVEAVQELLRGVSGTAAVDTADAEREFEEAQAAFEAAVVAFDGIDPAAANVRLRALQDERDAALNRLRELRLASGAAVTVTADDWGDLTPDERRALVRAVVDRAEVAPADGVRGADRMTVLPRGE